VSELIAHNIRATFDQFGVWILGFGFYHFGIWIERFDIERSGALSGAEVSEYLNKMFIKNSIGC